jgi:hypothetical protein
MHLHKVIQVDGTFVNHIPKKQRSQDGMKQITPDMVFKKILKTKK